VRQTQFNYVGVFLVMATIAWLLLELLRRRWFDLATKIDELEVTRGELIQSEKMASLGRMVAGFAHEINTPVGVAVGAVSHSEGTVSRLDKLLSQEEVTEEALRCELDDLRQSGALAMANLRRAAHLVQSFKRTSVDQGSEQVRPFDLRELIDDVLFALNGQLKKMPIQVEVDCAADLQLLGKPGLVQQLLTNLLLNSMLHGFDSGKQAGKIRVQATCANGTLHIVFSDDGCGIAPDVLSHIFEPFYTTRRGEGGSGLGLYICYNIVAPELGGSIQCSSTLRQGCRFDIRFPAILAETDKQVPE
jgi:signal transduction histidine kinase